MPAGPMSSSPPPGPGEAPGPRCPSSPRPTVPYTAAGASLGCVRTANSHRQNRADLRQRCFFAGSSRRKVTFVVPLRKNDTGRRRAVTIHPAEGAHCQRRLAAKFQMIVPLRRNDTGRVWAETTPSAGGAHCQRRLAAQLIVLSISFPVFHVAGLDHRRFGILDLPDRRFFLLFSHRLPSCQI